MNSMDNKLIVYDSNCKVCTSFKEWIVTLTSIPPDKIIAYSDLTDELLQRVDSERFKNAMALIDTKEGETLYGAEGVAYIFGSQSGILSGLFKVSIIKGIFTFLYKTLAYNRYIIATPASNFSCDCFPDNVSKYRVSYIVITVIISIVMTALFGISLRNFFPDMTSMHAAGEMLLIAGSGWIIQILISLAVNKKESLEYIGHLGSIMVAGLLALVPWILLHFILGLNSVLLPVISVIASSILMLVLHIHRVSYLRLSHWRTMVWFMALQVTAVYWICFFHVKN